MSARVFGLVALGALLLAGCDLTSTSVCPQRAIAVETQAQYTRAGVTDPVDLGYQLIEHNTDSTAFERIYSLVQDASKDSVVFQFAVAPVIGTDPSVGALLVALRLPLQTGQVLPVEGKTLAGWSFTGLDEGQQAAAELRTVDVRPDTLFGTVEVTAAAPLTLKLDLRGPTAQGDTVLFQGPLVFVVGSINNSCS